MKKVAMVLIVTMLIVGLCSVSYAKSNNHHNIHNNNDNSSTSNANNSSTNTGINSIEEQREFINVHPHDAYVAPLIPGGISDFTSAMPTFSNLIPLKQSDVVVDVKTYNGWCLDRIRLEDVEKDLLKAYAQAFNEWAVVYGDTVSGNMRYAVWQKNSVSGSGTSGGLSGAISNVDGDNGSGGIGSILPGFNSSTADPVYVLKFYLIK